jgi:putative transposase
MSEPKALTDRSVAERWREVKTAEEWWDDTYDVMRDMFKKYLEDSLECEMLEQLQADQYQRNPDRVACRNGYRYRSLQTRLGVIRDLRIPRRRDGTYHSRILPPYSRHEPDVDDMVSGAFLAGVSTRRVGSVMQPLTGDAISATTVSRISKSLDAQVRRYHERALTDDVRYLFLDGIVLKIKGVAAVQNKVVLAAYALTTMGIRELVDFRVATAESAAQWEAFLNSLYNRRGHGSA